jgi:hypothetical protein
MNRKNLTISDIGDYIRSEKRKGFELNKPRKRMFWNKKDWLILSQFVVALTSSLFEDDGIKFKTGDYLMGIKHFKL